MTSRDCSCLTGGGRETFGQFDVSCSGQQCAKSHFNGHCTRWSNLGGSFDNDADNNIFKATFGSSFGSLSFGNVAQTGLSEAEVMNDLTVIGSLAGGGDLWAVDLVYVPEPSTVVLSILSLLGVIGFGSRHRSDA